MANTDKIVLGNCIPLDVALTHSRGTSCHDAVHSCCTWPETSHTRGANVLQVELYCGRTLRKGATRSRRFAKSPSRGSADCECTSCADEKQCPGRRLFWVGGYEKWVVDPLRAASVTIDVAFWELPSNIVVNLASHRE